MKLDHLNLPVSNLERSRDWWVSTLGLNVEFEVPNTRLMSLSSRCASGEGHDFESCPDGDHHAAFLDTPRSARIKAPTHGWVAQLVRARHS